MSTAEHQQFFDCFGDKQHEKGLFSLLQLSCNEAHTAIHSQSCAAGSNPRAPTLSFDNATLNQL